MHGKNESEEIYLVCLAFRLAYASSAAYLLESASGARGE